MSAPRAPASADRPRIVVAVDFSEPSVAAARWIAQHFARGAELVLVHVLHAPPLPRFLAGAYPSADRLIDTARAGADGRLRELSASIATGLIWPEVRVGRPDEEIVRVAAEYGAAIIGIGAPAARSGLWARLGTTAQRTLRRSPVPVLLATGMPAAAPSRMLVAVDDSDMTAPVLSWGVRLARRFSAEATVVHVLGDLLDPTIALSAPALPGEPAWAGPHAARAQSLARDAAVTEAERWLQARVQEAGGGAAITPVVVPGRGRPDEYILSEATHRGAELLVIGSSGAGAAPRFLFGSVAEAVLGGASCPVLAVPPADVPVDQAMAGAASSPSAPGAGPAPS